MATLPDGSFSGTAPSDDGLSFWAGNATPGETPPPDERATAAESKLPAWFEGLRQSRADADYLLNFHDTRRALDLVDDPADVKAYAPVLRAGIEARAAILGPASNGQQWAADRDAAAQQLLSKRFEEVTRAQALANTQELLSRLNASALQSDGGDTAELIDSGSRLIQGLTGAGYIDDAAAQAMQRGWVQNYATAWIESRPPQERLALLGAGPAGGAASEPRHGAGTPAEFLPSDEVDRIRREATSELGRLNTEAVFARASEYEDRFDRALNGQATLPSRDDIRFDPELDEGTRRLLIVEHDNTKREVDAFEKAKAEYDNPKGRRFDLTDVSDQRFAEKLYQRLGANPAALHAVVNRAGILPDTAIDDMKGAFESNDPARLLATMTQLSRLSHNHPQLLTLSSRDENDLQIGLSEFRYYLRRSASEGQAARRFIRAHSDEGQAERRAKLKDVDVDAAVDRLISDTNLDRVFGGDPKVNRAFIANYRALLKDRYLATANIDLARAQANDLMKPLLDAAAEEAGRKDAASRPGLAERWRLNSLDGYYRGTLRGAGELRALHDMARVVEATSDLEGQREALLERFFTGVSKSKWAELREARWQEIKTAPQRYRAILADFKRYDEMKGSDSALEFGAAGVGQIGSGLLSYETYVGGFAVKAPSWAARAVKAMVQQAAIGGATDVAVQHTLIKGGAQDQTNWWQSLYAAGSGGLGGLLPGKGKPSKEAHGIAPEGPRQHAPSPEAQAPSSDVRIDEPAPVAPKPDAEPTAPHEQGVTTQDATDIVAKPEVVARNEQQPGMRNEEAAPAAPSTEQKTSSESTKVGDAPELDGSVSRRTEYEKRWSDAEAVGTLEQRVAKVKELASVHPVSEKYDGAKVGKGGVKKYAKSFHAAHDNQLVSTVEVHRAIEKGVQRWYPGLFTLEEINSLSNLRGIPKDGVGSAMHRSLIRREWNKFYCTHKTATRQQVLDYASEIDRRYGGLFIPPL